MRDFGEAIRRGVNDIVLTPEYLRRRPSTHLAPPGPGACCCVTESVASGIPGAFVGGSG